MDPFNRRRFLKATAVGAATLSLPAAAWSRVRGANGAIRVGVMGIRGRGGDHIHGFRSLPGVKVVAICGCDSQILGAAAEQLKQKGHPVRAYADVRKMLEDKDVDAVSTAAPNHWHALTVVWACQAGKDVYVEKPVRSRKKEDLHADILEGHLSSALCHTGNHAQLPPAVCGAGKGVRLRQPSHMKTAYWGHPHAFQEDPYESRQDSSI